MQANKSVFCQARAHVGEVEGSIVLTRYNNRTYHVDRLDFNKHPSDTFNWTGHGMTSYAEYALKVYGRKVTDMKQQTLVGVKVRVL